MIKKINLKKVIATGIIYLLPVTFYLLPGAAHAAPNLTATVHVEQTGANAAAARNAAHTEARRNAFVRVFARYAHPETIYLLSHELRDADIVNIVQSMSIADERQSATIYTANITITFYRGAAEQLFMNQQINHTMARHDAVRARTTVVFEVNGGLRAWAELMRSLNEAGTASDLDIRINSIWGTQMTGDIRPNRRNQFIMAMREAGWTVWDDRGTLRARR